MLKNIFGFLFFFVAFTIHANTYYVAKGGNDSASGTEIQPWETVQKAATTLIAGDTVYIKAGTYYGRVLIANSGTSDNYIVFTNYQSDEVIIEGQDSTWWRWNGLIDMYEKNYIEISGLKIQNSYYTGIFLEKCNHIIIKNNRTYNTFSSGIGVWECSYVTVEGNEIELACNDGEQECISISNSYNCEILKNHVHDSGPGTNGGEGIDVKQGSHDIKVYENLVHNLHKRIGIYADAWKDSTYNIDIYQNEVHHCSNGGITIQTEMGGVLENINIYNNISYYNKWDGIVLGSVTASDTVRKTPVKNVKIINNTCYHNGSTVFPEGWAFGILVDNQDAENVIIRNNICSQNDSQIAIQRIKSGGKVDHNLIDGYNGTPFSIFGSDSIIANPLFVSAATYNFHLQSSSPAIGGGSLIDAPNNDFEYNKRPFGDSVDVGAFEFTSTILLELKIFLEGAYNTNNLMQTNLNSSIPYTSPYSEDNRDIENIPTNIVDWILVELRKTPGGNTIVSKSFLLREDGLIVTDDSNSGVVEINAEEGNYYIVIKHRNHIAVMSKELVALSKTTSTLYNFTDSSDKFYLNNN